MSNLKNINRGYMTEHSPDEIRQLVSDYYRNVAKGNTYGCGENPTNGCCPPHGQFPESTGKVFGYSDTDLAEIVEGANMNLGCGNPVAISNLQPGETILELGCGGGFDSFLAANSLRNGRLVNESKTMLFQHISKQ